MMRWGDQQRFAAEIDPTAAGDLRRVDLWAAGRWLTCDDNLAFVPQLRRSIEWTLAQVRSATDRPLPYPDRSVADNHRALVAGGYEASEPHAFLRWGPTTDNLDAHLFRRGHRVSIAFHFCRPEHAVAAERGQVYDVTFDQTELLGVLERLLAALA